MNINNINFINIEKFKEFLKENLKAEYYIVEEYLKDLVNQFYNTGMTEYELGWIECKDHLSHLIKYEIIVNEEDGIEQIIF